MAGRARQPVVGVILVAWVYATLGVPAPLVLCYGVDGHIAVEQAHDVCDASAAAGSPANVERPLYVALSNSSCADIPLVAHGQLLSAPVSQHRLCVTDIADALLFPAVLQTEGDHATLVVGSSAATSHFHRPPDLLRLRSVILLV